MIRKQIYIHQHQQHLLQHLARLRGMSEAEVIRRAIDREISLLNNPVPNEHHAALEGILKVAYERRNLPASDRPYSFNRSELYEREGRWLKESTETNSYDDADTH